MIAKTQVQQWEIHLCLSNTNGRNASKKIFNNGGMTYKIPQNQFNRTNESLNNRFTEKNNKKNSKERNDPLGTRHKISPIAFSLLTPK